MAAFIWYELMTNDPEAAKTFYGQVVGWESEAFAPGDEGYTVLKAGGRGVGGILPMPEEARSAGARPAWLGYIAVGDVDEAARDIEAGGGALHRDIMDLPGVGRIAMVSDPQGAPFYLIAPSGEDQPPVPPATPGHVRWHELYAADGETAFDFYAGRFGWTQTEALDMGPMGKYRIFAMGGEDAGGIMTKPDFLPRPFWLFYFNVGDIDDASNRVLDAGGTVLRGPTAVPGGDWIIQATDPEGAMFALSGTRASQGEKA
jgi:hypothetical protein